MTGFSIPYIDSEDRVTGRIAYVLNMTVPGLLHGAILRSPYPHARLVRVDARAALAVPGVAAVLTGADLQANAAILPHWGSIIRDQPIVALDKVRFVGDPVAAVAAVDRETAEYAANLIEVTYEELSAVLDMEDALAPDAPLVHDQLDARDRAFADIILHSSPGTNYCNHFRLIHGDTAASMAQADHIFENVFRTPVSHTVPLEPHVAIVQVDKRQVTVWSSTQTPYVVRAQLAEIFGLPQNRVRVVVPTLGGGYGAKAYPKIEPLTAVLAWKAGAPVKITLSRTEVFLTITKHEAIVNIRTGVTNRGDLVARECELWWNAGAYADVSPRVIKNGGFASPGPYRIPHVRVTSHAVYTNRPPAGAFRGYGVAQVAWAFESQMDMIAERLGLDPLELRRRNLLQPGDAFCTGEPVKDAAFEPLLDRAAAAIQWGAPSAAPSETSRARGKGLAVIIKGSVTPSTSTAMLRLNADGSCSVLTSTVEMGQGSNTVLTQIAADALGLPYEQVTIVQPDTDVTPFDLTTSSSRSTFAMGQAVRLAAADVQRQALALAARALQVDPDSLEVRDGGVYRRNGRLEGSPGCSFAELIRASGCGNLMGTGTYQTHGGLDPETGQGIASSHWHQAAAAAEVEVDRETGTVRLLRLHAAVYAACAINPVNVELQTEGNAIFGLGKALMEEMVFDAGQLVNANLADYLIPSLEDLPPELTVSFLESPVPTSEPHGVGETALPPIAPAIGNAIYNAIGARIMSLPITPEKILRTLREGPEQIRTPGMVLSGLREAI